MSKKNNNQTQHAPRSIEPDGKDIEFSKELADHDDMEALARSEAADRRAKQK
ncbi:YfhD family protein [Desertibacillus haloalkaliphilus]|uniref:YfhD family protein n=1 Tax=Desertibacillus haloalkaliphilus TaxID=1328930 RepID=UPI001C27ED48|nr:YfhD family protein [Desertibacillus haloalkaliphilus]MBU8908878.1 YfhD family protein [Desertibacillus haloalkaliphilus]